MNYQILNKTDKDVRFAGQTVPAKSSVCIHASFVSAKDLEEIDINENINLNGNIVSFGNPFPKEELPKEELPKEELPKKTRGRTKKENNK